MNRASLERAAGAIAALPRERRVLVAIDGVDGAGKTTFADALAGMLDRPAVRATVDGFHHPRAVRYRRGRESPEGFYLDSFDLTTLRTELLKPFAEGARFRRHAFDHVADTPTRAPLEDAPANAALLLDGLFLHRRELRRWWDVSTLLDVSPAVAAARLLAREGEPTRRRYVCGQELYFADADPAARAGLVLSW